MHDRPTSSPSPSPAPTPGQHCSRTAVSRRNREPARYVTDPDTISPHPTELSEEWYAFCRMSAQRGQWNPSILRIRSHKIHRAFTATGNGAHQHQRGGKPAPIRHNLALLRQTGQHLGRPRSRANPSARRGHNHNRCVRAAPGLLPCVNHLRRRRRRRMTVPAIHLVVYGPCPAGRRQARSPGWSSAPEPGRYRE